MKPEQRDRKGSLRELRESDEFLPSCLDRAIALHHFRTAIVADKQELTYAALGTTANRLAQSILSSGGAPGDRVAILMEHDAPAVVAVIAVLKASRVVAVLNRTHPIERLRQLVEDCEPTVVVTDSSTRSITASIAGSRTILLYEDSSAGPTEQGPPFSLPPGQTAVLGYTSGSTGRPKGVMMTHHMLRRAATILTEAIEISADDRLSLFGSLSSAQGIINTLCALLNGATLCPFPLTVRGTTGLADWIVTQRISVYASSASIFRNFTSMLDEAHVFPSVRVVRLASEPATSDDFRSFQRHFPDDCVFIHTLSSSETGNMAWSRRTQRDRVSEGRLPIGLPSDGQELLLLDESGQPVPKYAVGEIVIRSRYLSAGYWRDPELTAKHFSGVLDDCGTRQFHTGDLGRISAGGLLEFCGRRDDQVKIRGNRIAFGEIENALHRLPGVSRGVAEAIIRPNHEPLLVAFITQQEKEVWSSAELRRTLRAVLPDYMVPSEFVILNELPLLPGGKIDRQALRQGYHPERQRQPDQEPKTEAESLLAAIWSKVFQISDVGRDEDFFALGGDSLIAALVAVEVYDAADVVLNLLTFAQHPTLGELAAAVEGLRATQVDDEPPLVAAPRTEPLPMSFAQERIWKYSQTPAQSAAYTTARIYRITGPLDSAMLRDSIIELSHRHEILRSVYMHKDGKPMQMIDLSMPPPSFDSIDLTGVEDPEAQASILFKKEAAYSFDLSHEPLLRFCLVRLRANEHWLLRVSHHIHSDNTSWVLYFSELALLYEAKAQREAFPRPQPSALQYGDYAAWQRKVLKRDGSAYRRSVSWWKNNLEGAPRYRRLSFARDRANPDVEPTDGMLSWGIERSVSHQLNELSSHQHASHATARLAALAALLAVETGESDVVIGMYTTGRTRRELLNVFGDFTNLMALRFRYAGSQSFLEWLTIVRDQVLQAELNSVIPFEELSDELRQEGAAPPELQVIFQVSLPRQAIDFAGLTLTTLRRARQSFPWGFTVDFDDQSEASECEMRFDPRIYDPVRVRIFVEQYKRLLAVTARHPNQTLESLLSSITT